ncbi:aminotransferase class V-fold PLP-dependent enzyme [Clostridium ganghwense]|uniref:Aminotransferase class V-fold PLP-dependent enzyme n=1 Tax=Clostridium ganghwense TaxID=312089 RepID=A0ABT4CS22_9CLOT|nr:aminotransferase class V-fold PLP-dependent enzyme [Clostridium ganghwense]MCY6371865.1 aminotransferase class V-fold PLP-dependent enzyme [Clostridium ganghwense]
MDNVVLSSYLRNLVIGMDTKIPLITGEYVTPINFDNAATTPPLFSVMREIMTFSPWYSSIHRGKGYKSILSSNLYEEGRRVIKKFVNADKSKDIVIYTKNTTESINILSYILCEEDKKQIVLSTDMEHLANDLPWRDKFTVDYVKIDKCGKFYMKDLENKLLKYDGKVKLVTVTGASNVTGYINPIYKIAKLAHKYGAKILVDGAQLVPHMSVDMKPYDSPEHIDYLVFSAHKMYAPFGTGVLIGPKETFEKTAPVYKGGGDVRLVSHQFIEWDSPPSKDEAGTPNIMGVAALTAAIKTLSSIGMNILHEYEYNLINYAINQLKNIPDIELYYYDKKDDNRVSLISFNIKGIHHNLLAVILSNEAGIAVRNGLFCAHPYVEKLLNLSNKDLEYYHNNHDVPLPGMVRISFGLYNNYNEIDLLIKMLNKIARNKNYYKYKYKNILY